MSVSLHCGTRREAWIVAMVGLVALASAMGIGRFAFTPLLPMMLHDGVIDLSGGGLLATANYVGYLVGAIACMYIRISAAWMIRAGLLGTAVFTIAMVGFSDTLAWAMLRALAGAASACVFVFVSAWCMSRLLHHPELAAIIFCGPGIGTALTGFAGGGMVLAGWRADHGWLLFGLLAVFLMALVWRTVSPQDEPPESGTPLVDAPGQAPASRESRLQGWYLT